MRKEKTINIPEKSLGDLIKQSQDLLNKPYPNQLILFEDQKKAVCRFYECCDSQGNQYPDCSYNPSECHLAKFQEVLWFINQKGNCQEKEKS